MRCCWSGPHKCEQCKKELWCDGLSSENIYRGKRVHYKCRQYVPNPGRCRTCFKYFDSRGKLFRHIRKEKHAKPKPEMCKFCNRLFFKRNIYGDIYGPFNSQQINDHYNVCNQTFIKNIKKGETYVDSSGKWHTY